MKTKNNLKKGARIAPLYIPTFTKVMALTFMFTGIGSNLLSQSTTPTTVTTTSVSPAYTQPSWWFGAAVGANFNFYQGSTQKINEDLTIPVPFHNGNGVGLFVGPHIEFHPASSKWGVMLDAAYDGRKGEFKDVLSPCNCPNQLSTKLSYISVESNLRFAPFKKGFYLYAGPRFAFLQEKSFNYRLVKNPESTEQPQNADIKGDLSDMKNTQISMQIGAGYDIPVTSKDHQNQFVISPFVSFQPYFGQSPRTIETWNITTLRGGVAFKFGHGHKNAGTNDVVSEPIVVEKEILAEKIVVFTVKAPANIPTERRVRETFPIRNYVFFDKNSTEIPDRYVLLKKEEVSKFGVDQLEVFTPKKLSGRSKRQMVAYYNVLNILGDRMIKKPTTTITLVGSADDNAPEGKTMAESVKKYLVDVFGIEGSRIKTEGRDKPLIPSEVKGGTKELELLAEGNRRVTIETSSPTLLMEFQSGNAPLLPVEIDAVQEAPLDSYVSFNVQGGTEAFKSWSIEIKDDKGAIQKFGPYTQDHMTLPGKTIMGSRPEGTYKVTMIGLTNDGKEVRNETSVKMVLWTPPKTEQGMRYSVLFDYNETDVTAMYDKYLTEIVAPKIPKNGTVIIHGYTDVIGDADNNVKISVARANEVKSILQKALTNSGRTDVKFELYGFGEDEKLAQFENKFPEERFYNRSVVIDLIPQK
jgi:outer membrane protein OmpA-like peptidoglycan-associated protein